MALEQGSGATCQKFVDEPHNVIMVLDQQITCEQAREIGKVLGSLGFTARFVAGGMADFGASFVPTRASIRGRISLTTYRSRFLQNRRKPKSMRPRNRWMRRPP